MIKLLDLIREHNYDCVKFYLIDSCTDEILAVNLKDDMCPYVDCMVTSVSYLEDVIRIYIKRKIKLKYMDCCDIDCENCILDFLKCFKIDGYNGKTVGEVAEELIANPENKYAKRIKDLIDVKLEEYYEQE